MNRTSTSPKGPIRIGRLVGGIALCVVGLLALLGGLGAHAAATWNASRSPLAEARAPGSVSFDSEAGRRYTIALGTSEQSWTDFALGRSERRDKYRIYEGDVAAARCAITHADDGDDRVRGDRQGASTSLGERYATVGTFEGQGGETRVECVFDPATETRFSDGERLGARDVERTAPFMVHERGGALSTVAWVLIGLGVVLAALGVLQVLRATALRRPRDEPGPAPTPTA